MAIRRREFMGLAGGAAVALNWPLGATAQEAGKLKRIGFLRVGPPPSAWIEALRQGLHELGYIEGQNIAIEFGLASSAAELPDVAAKLVRLKVDVSFASGTPPVLAAKDAAGTIPVVFVAAIDPVVTGLVASLARPGGKYHRADQHPSGYYGEAITAARRAASQPLENRGHSARDQSG